MIEIKEVEINRDIPCFLDWKTQHNKDVNLFQLQFNIILIKIPA